MKQSGKSISVLSYIAGFLAVSAALVLAVFLIMNMFKWIHLRKQTVVLGTRSIEKTYDGLPLQCTEPFLLRGALHDGHKLVVLELPSYEKAGEYENAPKIMIADESNTDVSGLYNIEWQTGTLSIHAVKIIVYTPEKSKQYDGKPLTGDKVKVQGGQLLTGHRLETVGTDEFTAPGEYRPAPVYRINDKNGVDMTDQYQITERFGIMSVRRIPLDIKTASAEKLYDGQPLSAEKWTLESGKLLDGHQLHVKISNEINEVAVVPNSALVTITDANGADVSFLYDVKQDCGTLEIRAQPIRVVTESAVKVYDGQPLSAEIWTQVSGTLPAGATMRAAEGVKLTRVGRVDNVMRFEVFDANGADITKRFEIVCEQGTLTVQPRPLSIQTHSATKTYDGEPLVCNTFDITSGSLCEGEWIELTCTERTSVGISDNYVESYAIYRKESNGAVSDVTACYRVTMNFGQLSVTAD